MCGQDEENEIIRLPIELLARLRLRAARQNISLNQYLAEIAREYLEHLEAEESNSPF